MKSETLEITGIRLIGFYFLFTTARFISSAILVSFYEFNSTLFEESLIATAALAATISHSILVILVFGLALIAMFRPYSIQRRWRKIESQNLEGDEFHIESLVLFRIAALIMALRFGQMSLEGVVEIVMFSNLSLFGSGSGTISNMVFLIISLFLFAKPEVIIKRKSQSL